MSEFPTEFKSVAQGVKGAEGPCVSRDGRVFMVCPGKGQILEVLSDGATREIANTGGTPAGLQIDRNNDLWIADMKNGVLRATLDGEVFPEVTEFAGAPIRGCNDCYFDSKGNLYFTAPAGSNESTPVGELFCRLADGTVKKLDEGYAFCNGLAVAADDSTLIVAETFTRRLFGYDLSAPGQADHKRVWATLPEGGLGPDGMDFDAKGHLLVAYYGGSAVEVYDPDGRHCQSIRTPFNDVTNVHFLGSTGTMSSSLLITEMSSGGLWRCEWSTPGQLQFGLS